MFFCERQDAVILVNSISLDENKMFILNDTVCNVLCYCYSSTLAYDAKISGVQNVITGFNYGNTDRYSVLNSDHPINGTPNLFDHLMTNAVGKLVFIIGCVM